MGGRWEIGSSAPCPAFFRPSGLRSAPPPPVSEGRPEGSLPRTRMPFPLHPGTRHCSGALPCCRPALAPASPPTCSHPQSRGRVGTGSATLTLLLLPTTCVSGNPGGSGCSSVQQIFIEYLLCARPCTRPWHQGDQDKPSLCPLRPASRSAGVCVCTQAPVGPEVVAASPRPASLRVLVQVASTSL